MILDLQLQFPDLSLAPFEATKVERVMRRFFPPTVQSLLDLVLLVYRILWPWKEARITRKMVEMQFDVGYDAVEVEMISRIMSYRRYEGRRQYFLLVVIFG